MTTHLLTWRAAQDLDGEEDVESLAAEFLRDVFLDVFVTEVRSNKPALETLSSLTKVDPDRYNERMDRIAKESAAFIRALVSNPTCPPSVMYMSSLLFLELNRPVFNPLFNDRGDIVSVYLESRGAGPSTGTNTFFWLEASANTSTALYMMDQNPILSTAIEGCLKWSKTANPNVEGAVGDVFQVIFRSPEFAPDHMNPALWDWLDENLSLCGLGSLPRPKSKSKASIADWHRSLDIFSASINSNFRDATYSLLARKQNAAEARRQPTMVPRDYGKKFFSELRRKNNEDHFVTAEIYLVQMKKLARLLEVPMPYHFLSGVLGDNDISFEDTFAFLNRPGRRL